MVEAALGRPDQPALSQHDGGRVGPQWMPEQAADVPEQPKAGIAAPGEVGQPSQPPLLLPDDPPPLEVVVGQLCRSEQAGEIGGKLRPQDLVVIEVQHPFAGGLAEHPVNRGGIGVAAWMLDEKDAIRDPAGDLIGPIVA
jgi:hypothetical protein